MKDEEKIKCYIFQNEEAEKCWTERYVEFLEFLRDNNEKIRSRWGEYVDPDAKPHKYNGFTCRPDFYAHLCEFLSVREKDFYENGRIKEKYIYEFDAEFWKNEENRNSNKTYGIAVRKENEDRPFTYLKSDQFGFSAPTTQLNHIYDKYLIEGGEPEDVAKWVRNSRTLGGSFLWPMEKNKEGNFDENPEINVGRGRRPLKDRADLTLLEIEKCYPGRKTDESLVLGNIVRNCPNLEKWLQHFCNFETFVAFFMLEEFVDREYENQNIYQMSRDVLGQYLEELCEKIIRRSRKMQKFLR